MGMSLDRLINILVTITLIEMMVLIGFRATFSELVQTARNWRLVAQALAANYVLVPGVTVALLILFEATPMVSAGFLILAVCPGAPYGPPFAQIARADVATAVGLMVILAGSSAIISPVLLYLLLPWISGGEAPRIDFVAMLAVLLSTQLLPLLFGLLVKHLRPRLAERLLSPFELVSKVLNLSVAALILATQFRMLTEIRIKGFVGMLILLVASLVIGWLAGSRTRRPQDHGADDRAAKRRGRPGDRDRELLRHPRRLRCLGLRNRGGVWLAAGGAVVGQIDRHDKSPLD